MTDKPRSIHQRIMQPRRPTTEDTVVLTTGSGSAASAKGGIRFRTALCTALAVLLLGDAGIALWQFPVSAQEAGQPAAKPKATLKPKTSPQPQQAAPAPAQATAPSSAAPADLFLTHATQAGVKTCAATYAGLGRMLTSGTPHMVQTQTAKTDADRHSLQGLVGMTFQGSADGNYAGPAAGLVFAAPTAQGCEGTMVRVVPFAQTCQATAAALPKGSQPMQPLSGIAVYALATGGQALLMPTGNGCIALSVIQTGG